jgi:hypothetical protein
MASLISEMETLQDGFWPSSSFGPAIEDEFLDDGIIKEECLEDAPFAGCKRDHSASSF